MHSRIQCHQTNVHVYMERNNWFWRPIFNFCHFSHIYIKPPHPYSGHLRSLQYVFMLLILILVVCFISFAASMQICNNMIILCLMETIKSIYLSIYLTIYLSIYMISILPDPWRMTTCLTKPKLMHKLNFCLQQVMVSVKLQSFYTQILENNDQTQQLSLAQLSLAQLSLAQLSLASLSLAQLSLAWLSLAQLSLDGSA